MCRQKSTLEIKKRLIRQDFITIIFIKKEWKNRQDLIETMAIVVSLDGWTAGGQRDCILKHQKLAQWTIITAVKKGKINKQDRTVLQFKNIGLIFLQG